MLGKRPRRQAATPASTTPEPIKKSKQNSKASAAVTEDSSLVLTNVNAEEYKTNPDEFHDMLPKRPVGAQVFIQFHDADNTAVGEQVSVDSYSNKGDLNGVLVEILREAGIETEELHWDQIYQFFLGDHEVRNSIQEVLDRQSAFNTEMVIPVQYRPEAMFAIRPITRASATLEGHSEAILTVAFSPDGQRLASGSGDTTVRLWDLNTECPQQTCEGHKGWVLYVAFAPDGKTLASAGMDHTIRIWDAETGEQLGRPLKGHTSYITSLSWEPLIKMNGQRRLASSSKDKHVRIWETAGMSCLRALSGHTESVTKVLWGGEDLVYSASQDRTIKVWDPNNGMLKCELQGHAHWVNTLALNTEYVLRTGCFDHTKKTFDADTDEGKLAMKAYAVERYNKALDSRGEILVSGSDDFTMHMWQPKRQKKSLARMTGHQALIIQVAFSPDSIYFVSASFDKSIKLWEGKTGKYVAAFRGHVNPVYQVSWSADSRLLVSGSKDSTLKVWDIVKRKLMFDLPGHADEVYAVEWSPDGERVCSGSKDRRIRIWRN